MLLVLSYRPKLWGSRSNWAHVRNRGKFSVVLSYQDFGAMFQKFFFTFNILLNHWHQIVTWILKKKS